MQKLLDSDMALAQFPNSTDMALLRSMEARRQQTEAILNARAPLGASPRSLATG